MGFELEQHEREENMSTPFNPEMFGAAMGEMIRDTVAPLRKEIAELRTILGGMQTRVDKSLSYAGEFQSALDYKPGSLVRRGGDLFVAVKHINAGGTPSARDGSGWERITSKGE